MQLYNAKVLEINQTIDILSCFNCFSCNDILTFLPSLYFIRHSAVICVARFRTAHSNFAYD